MSENEMTEEETFRIGEASKFLGKSVSWIRWRESDPEIFKDAKGNPIVVSRTEGNYRVYTLEDLRAMNEAFYRARKIDKEHYKAAKRRIAAFSGEY